jgi:hypothetical protein
MNKIIVFLILVTLFACNRKPFVEHKLKFEKVADDCKDQQSYFRMNSNIGGERFEFEKCLPADFNKDQLHSTRKGDTVVITLPAPSQKNVVYHITLDIDSYPQYSFISIDGDTYTIGQPEK